MRIRFSSIQYFVLLAALTVSFSFLPALHGQCQGDARTSMEKELDQRLKQYLSARKKIDSGLPNRRKTEEPSKIAVRQKALASGIRHERAGARQGDILGGIVGDCLTAIIGDNLTAAADKTTKEGNPTYEGDPIKVEVNAIYSPKAPLSTMPPTLLKELPQLPEALEYRFVGRQLILYDADACLIVDYLSKAK